MVPLLFFLFSSLKSYLGILGTFTSSQRMLLLSSLYDFSSRVVTMSIDVDDYSSSNCSEWVRRMLVPKRTQDKTAFALTISYADTAAGRATQAKPHKAFNKHYFSAVNRVMLNEESRRITSSSLSTS
jgi:hypothetical protein